jgi:hypothetical protein
MTDHAQLARQCGGRDLTDKEVAFSAALQAIYKDGVEDFAEVAARLTAAAVVAPASGSRQWTRDSLESELQTINQSLDAAYAQHGLGA